MIFVSMSQDELLERTAQYQIQYSLTTNGRRPRHSQIRLQPSHAYFNSVRSPLGERTFLMDPREFFPRGQADAVPIRSQGFRVTTDFDEGSEDSEDREYLEELDIAEQPPNLQYLDAEMLCSDDDEDSEGDIQGHGDESHEHLQRALNRANAASRRLDLQTRSMRRRMTPSLIEPEGRENAISQALGESREVLKPHARFFIQRDKDMVSIKFDPPA